MAKKNTSTTIVSAAREHPVLALRERDAAAALGISVKTLRNWRYMTPQKGPRPSRLGRTVVYPVSELERFLAEHAGR